MTTQQDVQELLRLLVGARKMPMLEAMSHVKALQAVGLKSIQQVAEAPLPDVERAVPDAKAARPLHNACKAAVKRAAAGAGADAAGGKRAASGAGGGGANKRPRPGGSNPEERGLFGMPEQMAPDELERSLALPAETDEGRIASTALETNRAPLVLAFAVELLRYTMPEQPPSSRLSMAQAVVAANSRSKAYSLGIENATPAEREGWGEGQPKVRVMGREIHVLKRGGYTWNGEESIADSSAGAEGGDGAPSQNSPVKSEPQASKPIKLENQSQTQPLDTPPAAPQQRQLLAWSTSQSISLKESTFVARATHMPDPAERKKLISSLMTKYPYLQTATHNAWAYRARPPGSSRMVEEKFDDGETGCGALILQMLRDADVVDTLVVLTRWFGGKFLGPDRFRLMRNCVRGALSERMRLTGANAGLGGEAVWGLDVEAMRSKSTARGVGSSAKHHETTVVGMQIHRPESARNYLLRSFAAAAPPTTAPGMDVKEENTNEGGAGPDSGKKPGGTKKKTQKEISLEKEENLGLLLGALRLLYDSWADHLTAADLDQRAWGWYTSVRPSVDSGPSGWGAKGTLELQKILDLRRRA
ncbi:hypothetical protein RB595_002851 [Gaeumannomyces hyphopodioides]